MRVRYSPESIDDLQRLVAFIEAKNPFAARRLAIDLQEGIEKLKQFPNIGLPVLKSYDPEQTRDLYLGHYTVRYLIAADTLYVLRVWHGKENEKNA
jgi:plasmid stabilization system protein ParE